MRFALVFALLLSGLSPTLAQGFGQRIDRHARIIFNTSLPPNCQPGWFGRGIGLVATCRLGWRAHVRFINGFVLPCATPDCREHGPRIDGFLRQNGF